MSNYVLNESKMFCDIADGIAIIINSETGIYYGMNNLGTCIYENIINGVDTDKILLALKKMSDKTDLEENFNYFINAMVEKEILIKGVEINVEPKIDFEIAKNDNYFLDVREYNDAQELLLADPIHEVKEETGWEPDKTALNPDKADVSKRESKMEK